jgi:hypothetical protein
MSTNETWCLYGDKLYWNNFNQGESLKCDEPISLLRSHNYLGLWITPLFCSNDNFKKKIKNKCFLLYI